MTDQELAKQLIVDAEELEGCGAGNEAANIREAARRLVEVRRFQWPQGVSSMTLREFEKAAGVTIGGLYVYERTK